ncbi:hypothetical protein [Enterococcus sp. AZ163]|uniref:hypothetical protein n=1 Tax=Enterococcus sp. AZ163 TaxID=2774638 RepID=UPI003D2BFBF7
MTKQSKELISYSLPYGWTLLTPADLIITTNGDGYVIAAANYGMNHFEQLILSVTGEQAQIISVPHQLLELTISITKEIIYRPLDFSSAE